MDRDRVFWGGVLLSSIAFIAISVSFFLFVIFPYHVDQMKRRAVQTVDSMQLVLPHMAPFVRQQYLEQLFTKTEDVSYLLLMDLQAVALAHSDPKRVGMRFDEPGFRRSISTGERVEQVYVRDQDNPSSPHYGEKTIDIIEPYFLADGEIAGAVNVGISLKKVEQLKSSYLLISLLISSVWLLFIISFIFSQVRTRTLKRKADLALVESERRLTRVIEATSDAIWEYNLRTKTLYYSPRLSEILSFTDILENRTIDYWRSLCHKDDLAKVREAIFACLAPNNHNKIEVEFRMRRADGHWQWVLGRGSVIATDNNGRTEIMSGTIIDIQERKEQEERLRESEARYRGIIENMQDGYYRTNNSGEIVFVSPAVLKLLGYDSADELFGIPAETVWINPELRKQMLAQLEQQGKVIDYEVELRTKEGKIFHCATSSTYYRDPSGQILGVEGVVRDIGERKNLQEQLLQAQKLESIGRLAGGVAHDFNNMLSVILGHSELMLAQMSSDDRFYKGLRSIQQAAEQSANLTRQLLAFARKQTINLQILDLNKTVEGMLNMLRRLIGEDITLSWAPGQTQLLIEMDPSQINQILANLCVNARDAITGTGKVIIETKRVSLDKAYCAKHTGFLPGDYIQLVVSDTGCGMDEKALSLLFEPFYTTKEAGKGTGLGMAMVYGIVKQNNGLINVYSEPGKGTTFRIYFPSCSKEADLLADKAWQDAPSSGNETILLVEDGVAILEITRNMLETWGYTVLTASTPGEAINLAMKHGGDIDILLTDVVMPEMNGRDLSNHILAYCPEIKCMFMSGYTDDIIAHHGVLDEGVYFIQKPFTMTALGEKLREVLKG